MRTYAIPVSRGILMNISPKIPDVVFSLTQYYSFICYLRAGTPLNCYFGISLPQEPDINILAISTVFFHFNSTSSVHHLLLFVGKSKIRL